MASIKFNKLIKMYFRCNKALFERKDHVFPKWFCTYIVNCARRPFIWRPSRTIGIQYYFCSLKENNTAPVFIVGNFDCQHWKKKGSPTTNFDFIALIIEEFNLPLRWSGSGNYHFCLGPISGNNGTLIALAIARAESVNCNWLL